MRVSKSPAGASSPSTPPVSNPGGYTPKPRPYSLHPDAQALGDTQPVARWDHIVLDPALEAELVAEAVKKATAQALFEAKEKFWKYENSLRADKVKYLLRNPPALSANDVWRRVLEQANEVDPLLRQKVGDEYHKALREGLTEEQAIARAVERKGFKLDVQARPTFELLCLYFARDLRFETSDPTGERSLDKGIMLAGNVGTGKSTLLSIFREANPAANMRYNVAHHKELVGVYTNAKTGGPDALAPYAHLPYMLDDIGREPDASMSFGNPVNLFEEVLEQRYAGGRPFWQFHISCNLEPAGIHNRYGKRILTRCIEMFNILGDFGLDPIDRRSGLTAAQYDAQFKKPTT
jgi:hypothetical protein